ncbi:MAG TPA: hydrolase [Caldithrix abyssi]|uniref:Hydrolase n=1 Tax=Caldithrix abyssi TaxID=187145 RepID=A0A7V4TZB4_CALAY|nr:hydrolase [Caldithrix abyssi]
MRTLLFLLIIISVYPLLAQAKEYSRKKTIAYPLHSTAPKIDGLLDDAVWKNIPAENDFTQYNPVEGVNPSEQTKFKILYDEDNIYFGIMCYDSSPDSILARLSRRDDIDQSDFVGVGLDSYLDRRTGFIFGVNAAGVRFDAVFSNDGQNMDESWDPVWEAATVLSDSGWSAELRIPYSQLRYADKEEQIWGLQVYRKIYRKQEEDFWQYIPKDAAGFVSYFGNLYGIKNISAPKRLELLPYGVASLNTYPAEAGNPFATGSDKSINFGLDGKYGLTSDLTVDFTVNPDFGQVEADPSVMNLSAFETYYEEKRPFFVEGKNIFSFPLAMGDGDFSRESLFYSRRIGRSPHYYPGSSDGFNADYVDMPEQTRILGAAKLSGKTKEGWSIGILDGVTNREQAVIDSAGRRKNVPVEPLTNYFVGRLQKDFDEGNTSVGGMLTATNRRIVDDHLKFLNRAAYTGGIDLRRQWAQKTYSMSLKLAGSHLVGDPEAIRLVQESSARYFQRPDAKHVSLDTTRTSLNGFGGSFNFGRFGNSPWQFAAGTVWRSPGFELNDLGYLRKADNIISFAWGGYRLYNPKWIFRRANINANVWQGWNFGGDRLFRGGNINGGAQFLNYWGFYMGVNRQAPGLSSTLLRGGPMARTEGSWRGWFSFYSDERKIWRLSINGSASKNDDEISESYALMGSFRLRIGDQLSVQLNPFYDRTIENLQYVTTASFGNDNRYIFGLLNQHTFGLTIRLNYSPTPDLSIQYYGQPFVSTGDYSTFKHITRPRAIGANRYHVYTGEQLHRDGDGDYQIDENGDGRTDYSFGNPNFNFRQFRSNLVVRWEYLPGSTLYLVWSQDRTGFDDNGTFHPGDEFKALFGEPADNIFLIKASYWFSI